MLLAAVTSQMRQRTGGCRATAYGSQAFARTRALLPMLRAAVILRALDSLRATLCACAMPRGSRMIRWRVSDLEAASPC